MAIINGLNGQPCYILHPDHEDYFFTSSQSWTIPRGAKRLQVTCIGGGGGAGSAGYNYGGSYETPGGGGGGGAGEKKDGTFTSGFTAGSAITVTVGACLLYTSRCV